MARKFSTSSLDSEFKDASRRINTLKEEPDNDTKLQLYALFKQVRIILRVNSAIFISQVLTYTNRMHKCDVIYSIGFIRSLQYSKARNDGLCWSGQVEELEGSGKYITGEAST